MFSRKLITIFLFITILLLIYLLKPSLMFDKDGTIKNFGYISEEKTTLITIFIAIPIIAIICYILVLSFELVYT